MNCAQWEEKIALYSGGDLAPAEAVEVAGHLRDCPGCQLFASGLKESLDWLQEMDREPIAPAHFAAVRARVLAQLQEVREPWWRKTWGYGVAAAAIALVLMLILVPHGGRVSPRAMEKPLADARGSDQRRDREGALEKPVAASFKSRKPLGRRTKPRSVSTPVEPGPPLVVKLVTDDPDIVIYWITDKSGE